MTHERKIR